MLSFVYFVRSDRTLACLVCPVRLVPVMGESVAEGQIGAFLVKAGINPNGSSFLHRLRVVMRSEYVCVCITALHMENKLVIA